MFDNTSTTAGSAVPKQLNARATWPAVNGGATSSSAAQVPERLRSVRVKTVGPQNLDAANSVVEAAILAWQLPARVYRLSLNVFRYNPNDLLFMSVQLAENADGWPIAVVAHEVAGPSDTPLGLQARLLHGLFVSPPYRHHGLGRALAQRVVDAAAREALDGVSVRAWRDAVPFFSKLGFRAFGPAQDAAGMQPLWRATA